MVTKREDVTIKERVSVKHSEENSVFGEVTLISTYSILGGGGRGKGSEHLFEFVNIARYILSLL